MPKSAKGRRLVLCEDEATRKGLDAALFSLCVEVSGSVVGCGRVIGDGWIYYYIQDILVHPKYQRLGIGKQIMKRVLHFLEATASKNAFYRLDGGARGCRILRGFRISAQGRRPAGHVPGLATILNPESKNVE